MKKASKYFLSVNFGVHNKMHLLIYSNINGKICPAEEATVAADNGAFRYGYGLFETMLVRDGAIQLKEYHWQRLWAGAEQLYLQMPALMNTAKLEAEVLRTVQKNKQAQLCRVRLQLFAGGGGLYGINATRPQYIIECFPLTEDMISLNENGLDIGIAEGIAKSADALSNLKSCNALIYAVGARMARENKWNDALICNTQGNIIESTLANIFWVKDGSIYTPPLSEGCVAGIMRRHIMTTLGNVSEQPLDKETLLNADEVFLTNAIKKVKWVRSIGQSVYGCSLIQKILPGL